MNVITFLAIFSRKGGNVYGICYILEEGVETIVVDISFEHELMVIDPYLLEEIIGYEWVEIIIIHWYSLLLGLFFRWKNFVVFYGESR